MICNVPLYFFLSPYSILSLMLKLFSKSTCLFKLFIGMFELRYEIVNPHPHTPKYFIFFYFCLFANTLLFIVLFIWTWINLQNSLQTHFFILITLVFLLYSFSLIRIFAGTFFLFAWIYSSGKKQIINLFYLYFFSLFKRAFIWVSIL